MPFPVASTVPSSTRGGRPVDGPSATSPAGRPPATLQIDPGLLAGLVAGDTVLPAADGAATTATTLVPSDVLGDELADGKPGETEASPAHAGTEPCSCCSGSWTMLGAIAGLAGAADTGTASAASPSPSTLADSGTPDVVGVTAGGTATAAPAPSAAGEAAATTPAGAADPVPAGATAAAGDASRADATTGADTTAVSAKGDTTVAGEGAHAPSLPSLPTVAHRNARARSDHGSPSGGQVPPGPSPMAADTVPGLGPRDRTAPGLDEEARTAPVETAGRETSRRADAVADPGTVPVRTTAPETPGAVQAPARAESLLRAEHVRYARELAPSREIQRLAVELDDARVAVRFDQGAPRVDVIADPSNRLGASWLADVRQAFSGGAFAGRDGLARDAARNGQGRDRRRDDDGRAFGKRIEDLAAAALRTDMETEGVQP
jgi:hypothetical protein